MIYINDIHDALCLSKVETKIVTNKGTIELNKKVAESDAKIEALTNENAEKDKKIEELTQLVTQTQEQMAETSKVVEELKLKREKPEKHGYYKHVFFHFEDVTRSHYF